TPTSEKTTWDGQHQSYTANILFEEVEIKEYLQAQQVASIVHSALTPGAAIFSLPRKHFDDHTEAYSLFETTIDPVLGGAFNPLSLRGTRSRNDLVVSMKFMDELATKEALEVGVELQGVNYKVIPYWEKVNVSALTHVNIPLPTFHEATSELLQHIQQSISHYRKVVQIRQLLRRGYFEGEISVLLDRSDEGLQYQELQRMFYLDAWCFKW
ncbi:MAG: hypothetical protein EXX96DRAFT_481637, partial [Benjaminiella poitrasii]